MFFTHARMEKSACFSNGERNFPKIEIFSQILNFEFKPTSQSSVNYKYV